jgi:hypothetical protein
MGTPQLAKRKIVYSDARVWKLQAAGQRTILLFSASFPRDIGLEKKIKPD